MIPKPAWLLSQQLVDKRDHDRPLADCRGNAFDIASPNISGSENSGQAGFQQEGPTAERPMRARQLFWGKCLQGRENVRSDTFWSPFPCLPHLDLTRPLLRRNIPGDRLRRPDFWAGNPASPVSSKNLPDQKEEVVMDLLVTVIGNAAVDPLFRDELLANPRAAIDLWGFRLTKGEVELLESMFTHRQTELRETFEALENVLYENLGGGVIYACQKPCHMSVSRPISLKKAA